MHMSGDHSSPADVCLQFLPLHVHVLKLLHDIRQEALKVLQEGGVLRGETRPHSLGLSPVRVRPAQ